MNTNSGGQTTSSPGHKLRAAEMAFHEHTFRLSDGEIHYLWWFIQGSIMSPSVRDRLWDGWGMCERHAWGFISVEASFRRGYMHGPAILYEDLMTRAAAAFLIHGPMKRWRIMRTLQPKGPCLMCEMGYGPHSKGSIDKARLQTGRDLAELKLLAAKTAPYWRRTLCGCCAGNGSVQRCRSHLIEDISQGRAKDLSTHAALVEDTSKHIKTYARSFRYGFHGTATDEDAASLITAVGWCSGWKIFLSIVE